MIYLLNLFYYLKFKTKLYRERFLLKFTTLVKVSFALLLLNYTINVHGSDEITIAKGQVHEITGGFYSSYIIGNKEVLNVRYSKKTQKLHIKAKSTGFSELTLIKKKHKRVLKIYVLSKTRHLKLLDHKQKIDQIKGLSTSIKSGSLFINGKIDTAQDFYVLHSLIKGKSFINDTNVEIAEYIKKKIIYKIYKEFFTNYFDEISCQFVQTQLHCQTTKEILKHKEFINKLKNRFSIQFHHAPYIWNRENIELEIRVLQIERLDGKEIDFGLSSLSLSLGEILEGNFNSLKEKMINFSESNYNISTLSRPKALLSLNQVLELSIGTDIPYHSASSTLGVGQVTWKFAGIKIEATVKKVGNKYQIVYSNEISRPISSSNSESVSISGSRQKSVIQTKLDQGVQLFEINLQTTDINNTSTPLLNKIPILKNIFSSQSNIKTYKKVIAIAKLTKR